MRRIMFVVAIIALASVPAGVMAQTVSYQYQTSQTNYNVTAGNSVTVNVYLVETITGGAQSLVSEYGGLFGASSHLTTVSNSFTTISGAADNVVSGKWGGVASGGSGM